MLRTATLDDLTTVASWITSPRDSELWAGWRVRFPIDLATLPVCILFSEQHAYAWVVDGQMVAFGQLVLKPGGRKHLATIIVNPALRRRGHGEAIVGALLAQAGAQCPIISLNVDEQNLAAISLYQRLGFVDAPRPPDEPLSRGSRYMIRHGTGQDSRSDR